MKLIKAEKTEKSQYTLEFSVDQATFEEAVSRVYKKSVKNMNVPGFRRGKAPRHIIEKMYGKGVFYEDALNDIIPGAYSDAVKEAGIEPVAQPDIDVASMDENGVVLTAKVYVKPDVEIKDYVGLQAPKKVEEVKDEEVESEIAMVRQRNSREIEITDAPAQNEDTVKIDYEGFVDGVAFDGGKGENHSLKLGSGQFIPGFEDQIVGKKIGEEFDVNVTFPADYHAAELAGKAAVFKVKLNAITHTELPELDDEFAKDVSEFDTIAEYRADLKAKIQKRHEQSADAAFEGKVMEALIGKLEADIPAPMFDNEVENMVRDYDNRLRMQGLDLNMYFKYTGLTLEKLREQMRPQAETQVKGRLALEKVAALENIVVTDEDLNAEFEKIAKEYNMEIGKVKEALPADTVSEDLKVRKALDFIKEKAVIVEEEAAPAPAPKKVPAKKSTAKKAAPKAGAEEAPEAEATEAAEGEVKVEAPKKKPAAKKTTTKTAKTEEKAE